MNLIAANEAQRIARLRLPDNADKDKTVERIGFRLSEHPVVEQPCLRCGYDRRYIAEHLNRYCLYCEAFNP